jgi:hypothetical protein
MWVAPIVVLCPWVLAPTSGIDNTASQEIANASTSFSLELLKVLRPVTVEDHGTVIASNISRTAKGTKHLFLAYSFLKKIKIDL